MEIELVDQIMSYFLDRAMELDHRWQTQYMVNISTNGTLGDDPRVQRFMRKYAGRLSVSVTIDGAKEAHDACRVDLQGNGSYDRAIQMFRQTGGPEGGRTTKYTIAPGNVHLFAEAVRHLVLEEGVETLNCNCVYEEGWTLEHARELYRQLKQTSDMLRESGTDTYVSILDWEAGEPLPETDTQNWCGGDGRMLAFDVDGTVLPCMRYSSISIDNRPSFRIGDVDSGIARREDDRERLEVLKGITRQSQSEQRCLECPIASGCAWCTAYNYERTGTPDKRVTYICNMHQARVDVPVPVRVSQLDNDSGFQTQAQVQAVVAAGEHLSRKKVDSAADIDPAAAGADHFIYMVPKASAGDGDKYDEYMVIDGAVEKVGDWAVDLSGYVQKEEGKGLSSNDFTGEEKAKLGNLEFATDEEVAEMLEEVFGGG